MFVVLFLLKVPRMLLSWTPRLPNAETGEGSQDDSRARKKKEANQRKIAVSENFRTENSYYV